MKDPGVNILATTQQKYVASLGFKRKFLRLWGTELLDGVEVLKEKHLWYPKTNLENNEKLFRLLKMYSQLEGEDPEGITSAWVYLNPDKVTVSTDGSNEANENTLLDESLVQQINRTIDINTKYQWIMTIKSDEYDGITQAPEGETHSEMTTRVSNYLSSNYEDVFDNCLIIGDADSLESRLLSKYVLFDTDNRFDVNITSIDQVITTQTNPPAGVNNYWTPDGVYKVISHAITMEVTRVSTVQNTDAIISKMLAVQDAKDKSDLLGVQSNWEYASIDDKTNDFFYKGRLRASVFSLDTLKTADCNDLLNDCIDTGYQKKKVKWYQKLFVLIVAVVAVVICGASCGYGVAGALTVPQAAMAATVISFTLAVTSMAMAAWGDESGAGFAVKMGSIAGKVAAVAGIFNMITSFTTNVARETAKQALQEAGKEVTEEAIQEQLVATAREMTISGAYEVAKDMIGNMVSKAMDTSIQGILKTFNQVANFIMKNDLTKRESALQAKQNKLQEQKDEIAAIEAGMNRDLAWDFIRTHTAPMTTDQSIFNAEEYKYEPDKFTFSTGNILRGHISGYGRTTEVLKSTAGESTNLGSSNIGNT